MATKMTVQFNLFGGTVLKLGTQRHHDRYVEVRGEPLFISSTFLAIKKNNNKISVSNFCA